MFNIYIITFLLSALASVSAEDPVYRHGKLPALHFVGITPSTPLAYPPSAYSCPAPSKWFPWDYSEPWNETWSFRPMCTLSIDTVNRNKKNTYCTFVSRKFAEGRGIAILTSVQTGEIIASYGAFTDPGSIEGMNDLIDGTYGPPPYEMKAIPGKGFGLLANRTIYRGERVMQETPTFVYDREAYTEIPGETRIPMHWHMLYQLPDETREELMALHVQNIGDHIDDLMRTNAFGALYSEEDLHNNMLPRISRFNHDCRPNIHYYFDVHTMTQYVHAAKEISPGEELSVSYLDTELPFEERIAASQLSWGFTCSCSICRQPPSHIRASDIRLSAIKMLKDRLNDWTEDQPDRISMATALIDLYKLERLYVSISSAYEAAAYAYSVAGDKYRTMEYASKAVESLTVFYGGDHPLTADLETLMLNPEGHRTWKYRAPKKNNTVVEELEVVEDEAND